jgi:hypothetical protein
MTPEVTAVVLMENFVEKQEVVTNCDHLAQLKFSATRPDAAAGKVTP